LPGCLGFGGRERLVFIMLVPFCLFNSGKGLEGLGSGKAGLWEGRGIVEIYLFAR
jgi:hypothetical protein